MRDYDQRQWVLASSSRYRAALLSRFGREVSVVPPGVNERALEEESPAQLAGRLAVAKAEAVAVNESCAIVIGSDQVATLANEVMGKPGSHDNALKQLQKCSGQWVRFSTGLCVIDTHNGRRCSGVEHFDVHFRELSTASIEGYLQQEQPYDCAGSFKSEGLGVALFQEWRGRDPNALIGLPLMLLIDYLSELDVPVL